jgi:hypothetical protein
MVVEIVESYFVPIPYRFALPYPFLYAIPLFPAAAANISLLL